MNARSAPEAAAARHVHPLFVGGLPRSGSHILAHVIGNHSRYVSPERELAFHCAPHGGLPAFLEGTLDHDDFVDIMRSHWWKRKARWNPRVTRGLFTMVERSDFEAALRAFSAAPSDDRVAAARALLRSLLDPLAARAGKPGWVEHSPRTALIADTLLRVLPSARFVHVVRDGRDRACSVVGLPFGPDTAPMAIRQWGDGLRQAEAAARSVPDDRVIVVQLEDLVLLDRENTYRRICDFLELPDEPAMRSFFDSEVSAQRAHVGRWRTELDGGARSDVDAFYRDTLERLHAEGISCAPPERLLEESFPATEDDPPNPFDPWADMREEDA